jgi:hypothetical protein
MAGELKVNYIKSLAFREAACEGAIGGPTPQKTWRGECPLLSPGRRAAN